MAAARTDFLPVAGAKPALPITTRERAECLHRVPSHQAALRYARRAYICDKDDGLAGSGITRLRQDFGPDRRQIASSSPQSPPARRPPVCAPRHPPLKLAGALIWPKPGIMSFALRHMKRVMSKWKSRRRAGPMAMWCLCHGCWFRGQGLGAELFGGAAQLLHHHFGIEVVRAGADPANAASVGALLAVGFTPTDGPSTYIHPNGRVIPARWFCHVSGRPASCDRSRPWAPKVDRGSAPR